MVEKYVCPGCKKPVTDTDVMNGVCPFCHKLFTRPLTADELHDFVYPQSQKVSQPNEIGPSNVHAAKQKIDLTKDFSQPSEVVGKVCPYCQSPIKRGVAVVTCPKCNIPHHQECWNENHGCTTYGCQNASSGAFGREPSHTPRRFWTDRRQPIQPELQFRATCETAAQHGASNGSTENPSNASEQNSRIPLTVNPRRPIGLGALVIMAIVGTWFSVEYPNYKLQITLNNTKSKADISAKSYYGSFLNRDVIVLDFLGTTGSVRRIDPIHMLLQFGEAIKANNYRMLVLAKDGRRIFMITKTDLNELSEEYTYGNPVWSFLHLPERLLLLDGEPAFSSWTGGVLGVLEKQTEDLNSVIDKWVE
jgi:hypothetical protein